MKKKVLLSLVLLTMIGASMVFAQARPAAASAKKNAISFVDVATLFKGFIASDSDADTFFFCWSGAYERHIKDNFTVGADLDIFPGKLWDVNYLYFGLAATGRVYPFSEQMEKFFIGAHLGFNVQMVDGKTKTENGGFMGPYIGLRTGYRAMFGSSVFVEPSLAFTYTKGGDIDITRNGWQAGLRVGMKL